MAPPQPVKRRRRNPGMWDWEDEQDVTVKPVWIAMLKPDGQFAPVRRELKSKQVDLMCQLAHKEPDGSTPFIKPVEKAQDGRRDPETKFFEVRRQRNGIWMQLEVAINPRKQTLTCTCASSSTHYGHPCADGGGIMRLLGLLMTQEDYYKSGTTPPGEQAPPTSPPPATQAAPTPPVGKPSKAPEGIRVSLQDLKQGTTDLAIGVFAETQPIYFDPKRIEGAVEIDEGPRKVRVFGNRAVIADFTAAIVRPRLEAPLEIAVGPAIATSTTTKAMTATRALTQAAPPSETASMQEPTSKEPNVEAKSSDAGDDPWCTPQQAAQFLLAGYDAATARGELHAPTTEELMCGMYSLDDPTAHLEPTKRQRQRIYDLTRETKRNDGSTMPSQVARALEELRPDLEYWTSARWEQVRGASKQDEDATERRRNLKVGHKGQHWLSVKTK